MPLGANLAPAYGHAATDANPTEHPFQMFGIPSGADRTVTLEALVAKSTYSITGKGILIAPPYSYRRMAHVTGAAAVTLAVPTAASIVEPVDKATGVALSTVLSVAPVQSGTEHFVNVVTLKPHDTASNGARVVVHFGESALTLPAGTLTAGTQYDASVVAVGPFETMDAYLGKGGRVPPELATFATDYLAQSAVDDVGGSILWRTGPIAVANSHDDGDFAFTTSKTITFTTTP